jgi:hypothetical protein
MDKVNEAQRVPVAYYVRETRVGGLGYEGAGFRGSRAGP